MYSLFNIRILIVLLALLLPGFGCKSKKDASHRPTKDPTVYRGVTSPECAVEMQYGSYGSGIDDSAYMATMKLISRWNQEFTAKPIGREGETRLCLPLDGLKGKPKRQFIDSLKAIARAGKLVSVSIR